MKEYAIGYLAQRTGLAVSAIRHYESQGLIKPNRTTSGQRRFALYPRPACQTTGPRQQPIGPVFRRILKAF
jgi:predicted site-specific integrase-resolvase